MRKMIIVVFKAMQVNDSKIHQRAVGGGKPVLYSLIDEKAITGASVPRIRVMAVQLQVLLQKSHGEIAKGCVDDSNLLRKVDQGQGRYKTGPAQDHRAVLELDKV